MSEFIKNPWVIRGAILVGAMSLMGSSCDRKGLGDAPIGRQHEAPREVFVNPDGFPNLVATCVGDNLVVTTTREAAPIGFAHDPSCQPGGEFYVAADHNSSPR